MNKSLFRLAGVLSFAIALGLAQAGAARSETQVFNLETYMVPSDVDSLFVEFYAAKRGHVWPGNNRAYTVKTEEWQETKITLQCVSGEEICVRAWSGSFRWGVPEGGGECRCCCGVCVGGTTNVTIAYTACGPGDDDD